MTLSLIDTHCHLDLDRFDDDRAAAVERAKQAGLRQIVVPAIDLQNIQAVLDLSEKYPGVVVAVGIHPNSTAGWQPAWLDFIREAAQHPNVVAIGEIGLDYYWDQTPPQTQKEALLSQLDLAVELDLPVILHNRDATTDLLQVLAQSRVSSRERSGVFHSFSADWAAADEAISMGFYIGITGPVTFKKADELREVARCTPLERLLVETDAPFLAPHPHRGRRNEPAFVQYVAEKIAELREIAPSELAEATTANAERLFGLEGRITL